MEGGFWSRELGRTLLGGLAGAALGWVLGLPAWGAVVGVSAVLIWHLRQLHDVLRWLMVGNRRAPEALGGPWEALYGGIERLRRRSRKRKKRLSRLMRQFQRANEALPYGTVVLNAAGEVEWFNQAAARLLHLDVRRDRGRRITFLLRDPAFVEYLESGRFEGPVEIPAPWNGGRRLSIRAVHFGKHQVLLTVRDVTREQALNEMRRDFVANVSHELRTPLTVLRGYLEMLGDGAAEHSEALGEMRDQVARMERLVEDLLLLAALESPEDRREEAAVDVAGLVAQVTEAVQKSRGMAHRIETDLDASLRLLGVRHELHSLVENLVDNALRYTPEGTPVRIRWGLDKGLPTLSVRDEGPGIAPEHLPRLTERFYRADPGRARESGGTGLGLAIVKHVVKRHGGELGIESRLGEGSAFVCRFPADRAVRAAAPAGLAAQGTG